MAVYGYIPVAAGEKLTSAHMNGVAGQTVMRFSNAANRATALGGTVVSKGMVSFLDDTGRMETYSGTEWVPFDGLKGGYFGILKNPGTPVQLQANLAKYQVVFNAAADTTVPISSAPGYQGFPAGNVTNSGIAVPFNGLWSISANAVFGGQAQGGQYTLEYTITGTAPSPGIVLPGVPNLSVSFVYPAMYPLSVGQVVGIKVGAVGQSGSLISASLSVAGPF